MLWVHLQLLLSAARWLGVTVTAMRWETQARGSQLRPLCGCESLAAPSRQMVNQKPTFYLTMSQPTDSTFVSNSIWLADSLPKQAIGDEFC